MLRPTDPNSGVNPDRQARVTIDADAPLAGVAPLPARSDSPDFTVTLAGNDAGAGIVGFVIYSQTDAGAWTRLHNGNTVITDEGDKLTREVNFKPR